MSNDAEDFLNEVLVMSGETTITASVVLSAIEMLETIYDDEDEYILAELIRIFESVQG